MLACPPKQSGRWPPMTSLHNHVAETSSTHCSLMIWPFIPDHHPTHPSSAMYGSGPQAPTLPIQDSKLPMERWVSTTASLCAINTSCAEDLSQLHPPTFARHIETSFLLTRVGNSAAFASADDAWARWVSRNRSAPLIWLHARNSTSCFGFRSQHRDAQ